MSQIPNVAGTLELVENPIPANVLSNPSGADCGSPSTQQYSTTMPLHTGGWNYLFCDQHVKWMRPENTIGTGTMNNPLGMWTVAEND